MRGGFLNALKLKLDGQCARPLRYSGYRLLLLQLSAAAAG